MQPDFRKYDFSIAISDHVSVISGRFDEYKAQLQSAYSPDTICRKGLHQRGVYDMIGTDTEKRCPRMTELSKRQKFSLLMFGFIAAAFGGWVYEEICVYLLYHHIYNRGMLHLTLCPIYGFGAWGLYLLLHRIRKTWLYFICSVLIASAFEYGCSYLLEFLFHRSYWTYQGWPLSVQDRISLISSLIFGLLAVIFARLILPALKRAVCKGNRNLWFGISLLSLAVMLGDFCLVVHGN